MANMNTTIEGWSREGTELDMQRGREPRSQRARKGREPERKRARGQRAREEESQSQSQYT